MTPKEVIEFAKKNNCQMFDIKFMDLPGMWQHFSFPMTELTEGTFENGLGFDGSSIRGWRAIHASDMLVIPDPVTAIMDPFTKYPTLSLVANIFDPITKEPYNRDPRAIAQRAEAFVKSTGLADTAYFGPEAEFFVFDDIRYNSAPSGSFYSIDSSEASWNTGKDEKPNLGHKPRFKEGYFPAPPVDSMMDLRSEMVLVMQQCGIEIEAQHHEVASAGQGEIDMRFSPLLDMADKLMLFKYIIKNVAWKNG
ncbi:MAG: glutamine synthetase beta-grasp domain-containing protein, partial [Nitrospinota bacterium]|nr:glutamine synthetase beta-grasp domain-containing protein [Nitrospinota bacterium]